MPYMVIRGDEAALIHVNARRYARSVICEYLDDVGIKSFDLISVEHAMSYGVPHNIGKHIDPRITFYWSEILN